MDETIWSWYSFGLEYYPAFSAMIPAYVDGYLNSQKTIEKSVVKDMVQYSKDVITMLGTIASNRRPYLMSNLFLTSILIKLVVQILLLKA